MAWYKGRKDHIDDINKTGKTTIYKYRNWDEVKHRSILKDLQLWAAHSKTFIDEYDISVPYELPKVKLSEEDKQIFQQNINELRQNPIYDEIGVISLTFVEPENKTMWELYGEDGSGFCIGFDRLNLGNYLAHLLFYQGKVRYTDKKPLFVYNDFENTEFLIKKTEWAIEEEFRFVKYAIPSDEQRAFKFTEDCIKEIVLGYSISPENQEAIQETLRRKFKSRIPLYKMTKISDSEMLGKIPIAY